MKLLIVYCIDNRFHLFSSVNTDEFMSFPLFALAFRARIGNTLLWATRVRNVSITTKYWLEVKDNFVR